MPKRFRVYGPHEIAEGMRAAAAAEAARNGSAVSQDAPTSRTESFLPPLVPDGRYLVQSGRAEVREMFGRRILALICEVLEPREYDGTRLTWFAPLPSGRSYPAGSKFLRAWVLVKGVRPGHGVHPAHRDLEGKRFWAIVATVKHSWERDERKQPIPLPKDAQYSVIRALVDRG